MKKRIILLLITLFLIVGSGLYGILMGKREYFPFHTLKNTKDYLLNIKTHWWSIGIYSGPTPFELKSPNNIVNPVLTAENVTDVKAQFIADPFMIKTDSLYYMFFEVYNNKNNQGDIGYADSKDGFHWKYERIIIDEPFHLSFPYIFKWENDHYLIPESHQDLSVRLYKAINFPAKWEYVSDLIKGYHFVDPQIAQYKNMWWLFVSTTEDDNLNIYYSENLTGPWVQHSQSPVIKNNKHIARGGGRILEYKGNLYRYTQDCSPTYGIQVFAFEITELTKNSYKEKLVLNRPIVKGSKSGGWNSLGMHTVDPVQVNEKLWISTVDGF
ncbi:MAG: hypothetical protein M1480_17345 [Bacteroidetes bacterium]|nr:hypothetical protein [Bacteroidota bacterium]